MRHRLLWTTLAASICVAVEACLLAHYVGPMQRVGIYCAIGLLLGNVKLIGDNE